MSKKVLLVITVLIAMLVSFSLVAAQSQLPGSGWWSGQQIQNVGSSNASVVFQAYDSTGASFACGNKSVGPGASANFLTIDCSALPAGFVGSAVVSADQPIAAVVNVVNMSTNFDGTGGRAAGLYRGTDGSNVATEIAFPLMKNNFFGRSTALYVQNASDQTNDITVTIRVGTNTYTKSFTGVKPYAMVVVGPADTSPAMPNNSYGSAKATGTRPLAGTALEYQTNVPVGNNLHAYTAFTPQDFAAKAYCPLARSNAYTLNTGINVQNVGASAQMIKVTYSYTMLGQGAVQTKSFEKGPVAPNAGVSFFTWEELPAGAIGSAVVEGMGGGNIAVIVNDETFTLNPARVTAYSCFPDNAATKTTKVVLPQYKEFFLGDTAGVQIQNIGTAAATNIRVTYYPNGGGTPVTFKNTNPVGPNASFNLYRVSNPLPGVSVVSGTPSTLLNGFGSIVIEADQPVVAIANEEPGFIPGANKPASNQDAKQYEGFNQ